MFFSLQLQSAQEDDDAEKCKKRNCGNDQGEAHPWVHLRGDWVDAAEPARGQEDQRNVGEPD